MNESFIISDSEEEFNDETNTKESLLVPTSNLDTYSKQLPISLIDKYNMLNMYDNNVRPIDNNANNLNFTKSIENHSITSTSKDNAYIGLLILNNLSPSINFEDLWELFEPFGELESAAISNKNRKVGFVKFKNIAEANNAFEILNGIILDNQTLNIRKGLGDSMPTDKAKANIRKEKYLKLDPDDLVSSRFLLATNVFDKALIMENPTFARRLYLDFLNIITYSKASINHMFIDELSDQGSIYMACPTVEVAKLIFKALNGCMYDGRKVAVDCIPLRLYIHLFPVSQESE